MVCLFLAFVYCLTTAKCRTVDYLHFLFDSKCLFWTKCFVLHTEFNSKDFLRSLTLFLQSRRDEMQQLLNKCTHKQRLEYKIYLTEPEIPQEIQEAVKVSLYHRRNTTSLARITCRFVYAGTSQGVASVRFLSCCPIVPISENKLSLVHLNQETIACIISVLENYHDAVLYWLDKLSSVFMTYW